MSSFRPIGSQVLVKREDSTKQVGSILLPEQTQEKQTRGKVVAVGRGKVTESGRLIETTVKAGDTVLLSKWSGQEIHIDGVEHLVLKEEDILGVVVD